ncbi:MAG: hypothetical protein IJ253_01010 [Bacteroidaceae bacterium]|nr:hypothetical protein [Bacteroidaceae bacterium]
MTRRLVSIVMAAFTLAALLTGCSKVYDSTKDAEYYAPYFDSYFLPDEFNGEFAINWMVADEVVDTTRLQVEHTANVLSLPLDWLHRQIFQQENATIEFRDDETSKVWGLALRQTGSSDNNVYFDITKDTYNQRVFVDAHPYDYEVYFSSAKATAIYNMQWDSWTATIPIDSIQVADDSIRVDHRPAVVNVIRFNPAKNLSFISTKRTNN